MIPLSEPSFSGNEWQYVKECLDSGWISSASPFVGRFEAAVSALLPGTTGVALSSGTAALHLALRIAGVEAGDYVLVSDLTFVAPVNCIRYLGANPILVDVEPDTWQIDHTLLAQWLASETEMREQGCYWPAGKGYIKVLLPVHVMGACGAMPELQALAKQYQLRLVEDATEALGTQYDGQACGTFGDLSCLSFNGNKIITTGGGGMLMAARPDWAQQAAHLSTQARTDGLYYAHDTVGYNYRMPGLLAAVGLAQLECLVDFMQQRARNAQLYQAHLSERSDIRFQRHLPACQPNHWLTSFRSSVKEPILQALNQQGIQARSVWTPMHQLPMYADCYFLHHDSVSTQIFAEGVSLPSSAGLAESEIEIVCDLINNIAHG